MNVATDKGEWILEFILSFTDQHGMPPTIREIGKHFEISSTNGTRWHLRTLEAKGYITRAGGGLSRGIRVTDEGRSRVFFWRSGLA